MSTVSFKITMQLTGFEKLETCFYCGKNISKKDSIEYRSKKGLRVCCDSCYDKQLQRNPNAKRIKDIRYI